MTIAIDINDVLRAYTKQFVLVYTKFIDDTFEINFDDIDDFNFLNVFPFNDIDGNPDINELYNFKYQDYAFELFGRADFCDKMLPSEFNLWTQNTMRNFDEEKLPKIMIVSPFEMNLSIQSTLSFLARFGIRAREYYFPTDSMTIWDKCDVLITANPNLLENTPEGKTSIKIEMPYNKEAKSTYSFKSMLDVIHDENNTIVNLVENV